MDGAKLIKELSREYEGNFLFEYSPESFTGTEPEYAVEVCNAVLDVMQPTPDRPMIINLPVTVEMSMPHIYANQIEWCSKHLKYRDAVVLSTHPHNDRGCGVADAELAVLAGAQRIECCLFGNGERTGNVDAITLAMNMYSHGVDPKLDFSDMPAICEVYERVTRMHVYERSPYAGSLVFAAFSGSHQDAIAKGMTYRKEHHQPPRHQPHLRRDVIRINSQSGKGGIGFLLQQNYGYNPPPHMREQLGYRVKEVSDHDHRELSVQEVLEVFEDNYVNNAAPLNVTAAHYTQNQDGSISANLTLRRGSRMIQCGAAGNGRLDAVANAIEQTTGMHFTLVHYSEHALDPDTDSRACSYVGLKWPDGRETWGCNDITTPVAINEFEKAGFCDVFDKTRVNIVLDHFVPNKDIKSAQQSKQCREFACRHGIVNFFDVGKMGVEHALLPEQGIVTAGDCIIGADSHTCTCGADRQSAAACVRQGRDLAPDRTHRRLRRPLQEPGVHRPRRAEPDYG